jgi:hypothetical protein
MLFGQDYCPIKQFAIQTMGAKPSPKELQVERRRATRFRMNAPVILKWTEPLGAMREDVGRIRDLSVLGAFVVLDSPPPTGAKISLQVLLPALEAHSRQMLRFSGCGEVTRTNGTGEDSGFAARIRFVLEETSLDSEIG